MLLVIDCGNTNAVLALYDGQDLAAHWRVPSKPLPELDTLLATLRTHQAELQAENQEIDKVIIASVAASRHSQMRRSRRGEERVVGKMLPT